MGKADGDMRSAKRLSDTLQNKYKKLVTVVRPRQNHGVNIAVYEDSPKRDEPMFSIGETDGVITRKKNIALTILTADCVPILFFDEKFQMIGASHQGWRGMLLRMPQKMTAKMVELGCKYEDIRVAIGPSINACCYGVQQDRAVQFRSEFPRSKSIVNQGSYFFLSLTALAYEQLFEVGILAANIEHKIACTSCQTDQYYSYRKSADKVNFEEQASYIVQW